MLVSGVDRERDRQICLQRQGRVGVNALYHVASVDVRDGFALLAAGLHEHVDARRNRTRTVHDATLNADGGCGLTMDWHHRCGRQGANSEGECEPHAITDYQSTPSGLCGSSRRIDVRDLPDQHALTPQVALDLRRDVVGAFRHQAVGATLHHE
jgi:hypothetical protein